jgi:hypothetical protein
MQAEDLEEVIEMGPLTTGPQIEPLQVWEAPQASAAIIVAHPDDETLWAGGLILTYPNQHWFIASTCRRSDPDRSPKFHLALQSYGAQGAMADMDDGPEQIPLTDQEVQQTVLQLLPASSYDLVLTHAPRGEYTRHRRHEEVGRAVIALWQSGVIHARELRMFAYDDHHGTRLPQAIESAHQYQVLPEVILMEKYRLITEVYGFAPESWEARATPQSEAFWCFRSPRALKTWLDETR